MEDARVKFQAAADQVAQQIEEFRQTAFSVRLSSDFYFLAAACQLTVRHVLLAAAQSLLAAHITRYITVIC
jgi:hypothetical protein